MADRVLKAAVVVQSEPDEAQRLEFVQRMLETHQSPDHKMTKDFDQNSTIVTSLLHNVA